MNKHEGLATEEKTLKGNSNISGTMGDSNILLIHYSEIALKRGRRTFFERRLVENIRESISRLGVRRVRRTNARILGELSKDVDEGLVSQAMRRIFGVAWFAFAYGVRSDFDEIQKTVLMLLRGRIENADSFKIETRRSYKAFPLSSVEVNERIGTEVVREFGKRVDLAKPLLTVFIEIAKNTTCIYFRKFKGPGGLPVGSSGRVLCLLSGGFDSPVAAWLMLKRGANVSYIHFHPFSDNSEVLTSKIIALVRYLVPYSGPTRIHIVPAYPFTLAISSLAPRYDVVLFRRYMFKVAEEIAAKIGAEALVTGESLAQVASQTLQNIRVIHQDLKFPVFMPLIAYDKEEIVDLAKKIGTYDISLKPYKDCCSIISSHPETKAKLDILESLESEADITSAAKESIAHSIMFEVK